MNWISLFIAFILTVILTGIVRKFCITFEIVDYPSQRRTHQTVTPRGGGIAIVIVFLSYLLFYQLTTPYYFALLPALLIAFMGLWDDVRSISPHFRLAMQFICAITSVYLIGDFGIAYQIIGIKLPMVLDLILVTLFIVWSTNLYNFMDGVNGLAVIEALCLSLFMGSLALSESQTDWGYLWLILASGAAGFLGWNFPHAKIFLGDIGSHFFGFIFSVLLLKGASIHSNWFWSGIIVLGYFIVDATLTLLVRLWNRFSFLEPHRTHAYQLLWKKLNQCHSSVTLTILIFNILWLMPWAFLVAKGFFPVLYGLIISYLPIFYLVLTSKAGSLEALNA